MFYENSIYFSGYLSLISYQQKNKTENLEFPCLCGVSARTLSSLLVDIPVLLRLECAKLGHSLSISHYMFWSGVYLPKQIHPQLISMAISNVDACFI